MINQNDHFSLVDFRHFKFQINGFNERVPFYLEKLILKFLKINLIVHPQFARKLLSKFEHYHLLVSMDANNIFSNVFLTFCGLNRKQLKANLRKKKYSEYRKKKFRCYFSWKLLAELIKYLQSIKALNLEEKEKVLRFYVQNFQPSNFYTNTILQNLTTIRKYTKDNKQLFRKFIGNNFLFKNLYFLLRKKSRKGILQYKRYFYRSILDQLGLECIIEEAPESTSKDVTASGQTAVDVRSARHLCNVNKLGEVKPVSETPPEKPFVSVWVSQKVNPRKNRLRSRIRVFRRTFVRNWLN